MRYTVAPLVFHPPDEASWPTILAALDPSATGGAYYGPTGFNEMRGRPGKATIHRSARHDAHRERLWDLSCELTGASWPF